MKTIDLEAQLNNRINLKSRSCNSVIWSKARREIKSLKSGRFKQATIYFSFCNLKIHNSIWPAWGNCISFWPKSTEQDYLSVEHIQHDYIYLSFLQDKVKTRLNGSLFILRFVAPDFHCFSVSDNFKERSVEFNYNLDWLCSAIYNWNLFNFLHHWDYDMKIESCRLSGHTKLKVGDFPGNPIGNSQ